MATKRTSNEFQTKLTWSTITTAAKEFVAEHRAFLEIQDETVKNHPKEVLDGFEAGYQQGFERACRWLMLHGVKYAM